MKKYLLPAFLIFALAACKKDNTAKKTTVAPTPKYLVATETDLDAHNNVTAKYQYWYNKDNTLIEEYAPVAGGYDTIKFGYDKDTTLISVDYSVNTQLSYKITKYANIAYLRYNSDPNTTARLIGLIGDKIGGITNPATDTAFYALGYNYSNIVWLFTSRYTQNVFTYGTHKGAYYYSGLKYFLGDFGLRVQHQNEILTQTRGPAIEGATGTITVYSYQYDFNSNGYPDKATVTKNGSAVDSYVLYSYIKGN